MRFLKKLFHYDINERKLSTKGTKTPGHVLNQKKQKIIKEWYHKNKLLVTLLDTNKYYLST